MRSLVLCATLAGGAVACGGGSSKPTPDSGTGGDSSMPKSGTVSLTPSDDTFINGRNPDNNSGASQSIFVGVDGQGGTMRGLVRFAMPAALQGTTVTEVQLTTTLRSLGQAGAGPDVMLGLQAVTEAWIQGNGAGNTAMLYTVGETCSAAVMGATWNSPDCTGGAGPPWMVPGATVTSTVSGQADTTGLPVESPVVWASSDAGNASMIADVQGWIDNPSSNDGWRITSSDENTFAAAKRFYSSDAAGNPAPTLTVAYMLP
jgi:hypothetical protein